jgi:ATP-binding protein involved in chromosome partitioning
MSKEKLTEQDVKGILMTVVEPELGTDLVTLGYIDDIEIHGKRAKIKFHLTSPFSPMGEFMGVEIRRALKEHGIESEAIITDHKNEDRINDYINWVKLKNVNWVKFET